MAKMKPDALVASQRSLQVVFRKFTDCLTSAGDGGTERGGRAERDGEWVWDGGVGKGGREGGRRILS